MKTLDNYSTAVTKIRAHLRAYIETNHLQALVIGVSGGIDSGLVCALAAPVCQALKIPLIGRSITIESNKEDERHRAFQIGKHFCTDFQEANFTLQYQMLTASLLTSDPIVIDRVETDRDLKIRLGNLKARMRMIYLYDLAQKNKGLVLSTDNYTEYLLGFWTLCGDVGDYGMIQKLWKTEVYTMTEWLAKNEESTLGAQAALLALLDAVATDGLGITASDLDQLLPDWQTRHKTTREGYGEVDQILMNSTEFSAEHLVLQRNKSSEFKRKWPLVIERSEITGLTPSALGACNIF